MKARRPTLRLVPPPAGVIDADWLASKVMECLDRKAPNFWIHHPVTDRGNLRNIIVRVFMDEGATR